MRGEVKLRGNWNEFSSESATKSGETGLMVGAGFMHYNNRGQNNNPCTPSVDNVAYQNAGSSSGNVYWTAVSTLKWSALSVYGAFVMQKHEQANWVAHSAVGDGLGSQNQYGMDVQAGYRVTEAFEAFGRYEGYDIMRSHGGASYS